MCRVLLWILLIAVPVFSAFVLPNQTNFLILPPGEAIVQDEPVMRGECSAEGEQHVRQCFKVYLQLYGFDYVNNILPDRTSKFFPTDFTDTNQLCPNYGDLQQCLAASPSDCWNFRTLEVLAGHTPDAIYYLQQLSMIQLYCDEDKHFIRYSQCLSTIDDDDLQETIYEECSHLEEDTCKSVAHTVKCERAVVVMRCDNKKSVQAYCAYQNIQIRMAGWTSCETLCHSNIKSFSLLSLILSMIGAL